MFYLQVKEKNKFKIVKFYIKKNKIFLLSKKISYIRKYIKTTLEVKKLYSFSKSILLTKFTLKNKT